MVTLVTDLGAVGDGVKDNTAEFRRAARGKHMVVPQGVFVTGAFNVTSRLSIFGEIRAVAFSWDTWHYHWPLVRVTEGYTKSRDGCCVPWSSPFIEQHSPLIGVFDTYAKIDGGGVVDGNGATWWTAFLKWFLSSALQYAGLPGFFYMPYPAGRPRLVEFVRSSGRVANVTLRNSPFWTLHLVDSSHIRVTDVTITAPGMSRTLKVWAPNSDGIDVDSSRDVLIERAFVDVGDDAIAIKAGLKPVKPSQNIVIRDSVLRSQWFALGSETSGGISNVTIERSTLGGASDVGADAYTWNFVSSLLANRGGAAGVHVKTARDRGGYVRDVTIKDCKIRNSDAALWLSTWYPGSSSRDSLPELGRFRIENLQCDECASLVRANGFYDSPVEAISVDSSGPVSCSNVKHFTMEGRRVDCLTRRDPRTSRSVPPLQTPVALLLFGIGLFPLEKHSRLHRLFFAGTALRALFLLVFRPVDGAAPFASTPYPITAPWLTLVPDAWIFSLWLWLSIALLFFKEPRILRVALLVKAVALVLRQSGGDPHEAYCAGRQGCAAYLRLGEPAADFLGAFSAFGLAFLCRRRNNHQGKSGERPNKSFLPWSKTTDVK